MILKPTKPPLLKRLEQYLKQDPKFRKVYQATKREFEKANLAGHNWEHAYRDTLSAIIVGEAERADMQVVLPAITMHDLGFLYGATGQNHCEIGAQKLPHYLKKIGYPTRPV